MKRPASSPARLLAVIAAATAIIALGGWISASAGAPGASGGDTSVSWCCVNGSSPGITVSGQATLHGRGTTARDDAIARAVADATDQANAAADAAGITLGSIVDLQVSAPPYPYAVPAGAVAEPGSVGSGSPPSSGSANAATSSDVSSGSTCPMSAPCAPVGIALPYQVDVSVTITWSIA